MSLTKKLLLGAAALGLAGLTIVTAVAANGTTPCGAMCPKSGPCTPCPDCPGPCPGK